MTAPVELIIVERVGVRLGIPAGRITTVVDLSPGDCSAALQRRLGQPPLAQDERCFGLQVALPGGDAMISVVGQVSMATVPEAAIAPLPDVMTGVAPITAVVFDLGDPVLVLDVDAMVVHAQVVPQ